MEIIGAVLVVLGAWLILAAPVALLLARFLHTGAEREVPQSVPRTRPDSYDTAA